MRQSVRLGRIAGIEIGAHWSVLVIAALLAYGLATAVLPAGAPGRSTAGYVIVAIVVAILFLVGLLAHELAHALVARRYGVGVRRITLWLLGGVSELEGDPPTPRAELLIAGAGPVASLGFGGLAAAATAVADAGGGSRLLVVSLVWLAGVNIILAIFNLLPGAPLDGGRVVRAVVWRITGDRDRAQIAADRAGVVLGIVLGALGLLQVLILRNLSGLWLVLLGWFLVSAANAETAGVRLHRALDGRSVRDIMTADPVAGRENETIEAFVQRIAAEQPHASYPVVDPDGRLVGMVRLSDLARIPESGRSQTPLRAAAAPATDVPETAPSEPASTVARTLTPATPLVAVTEDHRLVGVVSTGDVANAIALANLRQNGNGHRGDASPGHDTRP
jgi:Zn-dependent protease/CBS domain-containing protein